MLVFKLQEILPKPGLFISVKQPNLSKEFLRVSPAEPSRIKQGHIQLLFHFAVKGALNVPRPQEIR